MFKQIILSPSLPLSPSLSLSLSLSLLITSDHTQTMVYDHYYANFMLNNKTDMCK